MNLRVLLVSSKYPPEYAGSALRAHRTYLRLHQKFGLEFEVLCSSVEENTNCVYEHEGIKVTRLARKWMPVVSRQTWDQNSLKNKLSLRVNYFSEAFPTFDFLKKNLARFDLVHVFGNSAVTSAVISFCNRICKPLIVEITYDSRPQPYKPLFMKFFDRDPSGFHSQTQIICISPKLEAGCRAFGIYQNIYTRPNPIDTGVFHVDRPKKWEYRVKHSEFSKSDVVLVNVSKFMPLKNQVFLLEVLKLLPEKYKLFLAGPVVKEGPNAKRDAEYLLLIKNKIAEYKLQTRVQYQEGFVAHTHELIKMSDMYVFPSKVEGLGTPMIESICCGVPVVAHRLPGVTDAWIKEGENGYTCALNAAEFARKIQQAAVLSQEKLDTAAMVLQNIAGEERIDEEYFRLIQSLTQKKMNQYQKIA